MPGSAAPVFVSYSHKDSDWLERCRPYLRPLHREGLIDLWDDERIGAGAKWREEIQQALEHAKVAVLLVSQDFLASDFIHKHELPPLLDAAKLRGLTILWMPLRHSTYETTPLATYQSVGDPAHPLNSLPEDQADLVLKKLHERVRELVDVHVPATSEGEPIFLVPFERNPAFTGREDVLADLDRALLQGVGALSQTAGIAGLGGVGKTQTAVEYVYRHNDQYTAVLWAVADSEQTLASGYAEIARKLDLAASEEQNQAKVRDAVKAWLEQHAGWLLVLDNADTPGLVKPYLPHRHRGCVLVTSRAYTLQEIGIIQGLLRLDTLPSDEAQAFLFARTQRDSGEVNAAEQAAAAALVKELGYLPLAIEQAAAYLVETGASFAAYLASYRKRHIQLLEKGKALARTDSVATTWALNFAEIEKTPASADLLRLSAFLAPDAIPLDLLALGSNKIEGPLGAALAGAADDPLALDDLLKPLLRYSLVKREPGAGVSFSVHRLIQTVVREQLGQEQRKLWAERAIAILIIAFPDPEFGNWSTCDRLVAHGQAIAGEIERGLHSEEAALLTTRAGLYLWQRRQYLAAEPLFSVASTIYEQVRGPNHPYTATSLNNLAALLSDKGDLAAAETLYRRSLAINEKELGPNHPEVANGLNNLALLLRQKRDLASAEPLYRRALAIREEALGPNHPATAASLNDLASLLRDKSDRAAAEPLLRRALAIRENALAHNHPDTATSLNDLAFLLQRKGDVAAAEPLYRRALDMYGSALGPDHPHTITARNNLINLLTAQGRTAEADAFRRPI